jgi:hypothetical protein
MPSVEASSSTVRSVLSGPVPHPGMWTSSIHRLVSHHRQPSKIAPEYGSPPEIAGTPAPGSAFMSSLGHWPPFDRCLWRGQSAFQRLMTGYAGRPAPHPPSIKRRETL